MNRLGCAVLLFCLPAAQAQGTPVIEDVHVEEALAEAGENRGELEKVLAHFAGAKDPRTLVAARFLVANMPGHGHIQTEWRDKEGNRIEFDPLVHPDFKAALAALDELEAAHGELDWHRARFVPDVETLDGEFLIEHIERAFTVWQRTPERVRPAFGAFLEHLLPYRGSEEPAENWLGPLMERYGGLWEELGEEAGRPEIAARISTDLRTRLRFNERYYLHPTDQGFFEMERSGQGRCEDLTNMATYALRSVGVAVAADYTPYWAHRDNNHAWTVLLDADGRGSDRANAHAAKVYRKTYSIRRDNLRFRLPEGREAPNRFLASRFYVDVTDQYAPTSDVTVELDPAVTGEERFAYLCVFNGGEWRAIHWAEIREGRARFDRMGRNIVYLPAVHGGQGLIPAAAPRIVHRNGCIETLPGVGGGADLLATSVRPRQKSADTGEETPTSHLEAGVEYTLFRWNDGWEQMARFAAGAEPARLGDLPGDGLYWLVARDSRRLERIFTIDGGRQRFW